MALVYYVLLAILAFFIIGPALLQDRSPIPEISGNVHKVASRSEFEALLKSTANVVVEFYADWCPPCRAIAPVFSRLADQHTQKDHLAFAKVNVDHVTDVSRRYGISSMPTFVFFERGQPSPVTGAEKVRPGRSVVMKDDGVERILGSDRDALVSVVRVLGAQARKAAGVEG